MRFSILAFLLTLSTALVVGPVVTVRAQAPCNCEPLSAECEDCDPWCNMCPCTYGVVEGLFMDRNNRSADRPLVQELGSTIDPTPLRTLLSTGDLNPDVGAGMRVLVGTRLNECWAVELGYFGIFGQTANSSVVLEDLILIPGDLGLNVNNFVAADRADIQYSTNLQSAEANLVRCNCCCDCDINCRSAEWLLGFRYLNLDERFSLTAVDSAESSTRYAVRTQNHLFGAQVGSRLRRCYGRWSVEGTGKAGLYANDASQSADAIIDFDNFERRPAVSSSTGQVAFVGELNLTGVYQINSCWGLRAGYNLLWVEGVALAPDQLDFTFTPTSGTAIVSNGGVFMHGVSAGVEARF